MKSNLIKIALLRCLNLIIISLLVNILSAQNNNSLPVVKWINPSKINTESSTDSIELKVNIISQYELQDVKIFLNDSEVNCNVSDLLSDKNSITYSLTKIIKLVPGKNSVYIVATNSGGSTQSKPVRVINCLVGSFPIITFISPTSADSVNDSGTILVRALIVSRSVIESLQIFRNEIEMFGETVEGLIKIDSITYTISKKISLQKGNNTLYLVAKNSKGIGISNKQNVQCIIEPLITWILPDKTITETTSGTVNIRAKISSFLDLQNVKLSLNGAEISPEEGEISKQDGGTYIFERTLHNIFSPRSTFSIIASNIRGTTTSEPRIINFTSGSKPVVKITSIDSLNNTGIVPYTVEIVSRTKLLAIRVILNGTILANESSKIPEQKDSITYILNSLIPLNTGINTFYVEAKNATGTSGSGKRTIICQPEPTINWISPAAETSTKDSITVKVRAEIVTCFDLTLFSMNLNGTLIAGNNDVLRRVANDKYILEQNIQLKSGENNIIITASNARGTGSSTRRSIKYVPVPVTENRPSSQISKTVDAEVKQQEVKKSPETSVISTNKETPEATKKTRAEPVITPAAPAVTWLSPSRDSMNINLSSAKIKASVRSFEKLQSLLVYVNGVASEDIDPLSNPGQQGDYLIEKSISLGPGENKIYIVATNSMGTTRSETRHLTNPPINPPSVIWTVPSEPISIVNLENVVVEACIKSATELKELKILVNGIQQESVMTFQAPMPGDCNYRIAKSVILKDGENSIYIIADNYAGTTKSEKRVIRFQTGIADKRLALVIGNSNYGNAMMLKNPVNDANLIEGTLKRLGFDVIKYLNATKDVMMKAVWEFSKKLPQYNVALFYYAGHGVQVDGENYLVPIDAKLNEKADCKFEAVPVNFIVEEFEKVPDNINIVILDACRNNPFKSWARGGAEGFRALNAVTGTIVGFATSENSTAADGSGLNGTYTEELVRQMEIPQSISSVFINTRKQVLQRTNNTQRPQEWNMLTGDFYFKK